MGLDVRLPVGWMFFVMGALLAVYGTFEHVRIDLVWGLVLIGTSVCLLVLAYRSSEDRGASRR